MYMHDKVRSTNFTYSLYLNILMDKCFVKIMGSLFLGNICLIPCLSGKISLNFIDTQYLKIKKKLLYYTLGL